MVSNWTLYHGADNPPVERYLLRAGKFSAVFENGDLRSIRLGGKEIIRRIYMAVRDRNWGTVLPVFSQLTVESGSDFFHICFDVNNRQGPIDFAWHGEIFGGRDSTITFRMEGEACSSFQKNRIGFCVLHPALLAGTECQIEHVDGSIRTAVLPEQISPEQPVPGFGDLRSIRHQVHPGIWAEVRMEGDTFEMEDQRNWTDASYKTFSTPLRLPYPVEIAKGTRVLQTVTVQILGEQQSDLTDKSDGFPENDQAVTISIIGQTEKNQLPRLGLSAASHGLPLSNREYDTLRRLKPDHIRVDLQLWDQLHGERLRQAAVQAEALGAALYVAVIFDPISSAARQGLENLRKIVEEIHPPVKMWLVFPNIELFNGGSPVEEAVILAKEVLAEAVPGAGFASGTNADLIFFQRSQPPYKELDAVCFSINPQVHAFDDASVMETPEAQAAAVRTARCLANGMSVLVSPVTLKPRFNPYATGPEENESGSLPPQVDPRQMSLLGAAWAFCSLKYLTDSQADSVTYFETTGWRGVMETEAGSPSSGLFPSRSGQVFPLYHVLADAVEFSSGAFTELQSSEPQTVTAMMATFEERTAWFAANMTADRRNIRLQTGPCTAWVRSLDENSAEQACSNPEMFRSDRGLLMKTHSEYLDLTLLPYAYVRIDIIEGPSVRK